MAAEVEVTETIEVVNTPGRILSMAQEDEEEEEEDVKFCHFLTKK